MSSDWGMPYTYEGAGPDDKFSARTLVVDPNFRDIHNIEFIAGRNFSDEIKHHGARHYQASTTTAQPLGLRWISFWKTGQAPSSGLRLRPAARLH